MRTGIEKIIDENILGLVTGGNTYYVSTETLPQNVLKFYLNLVPFVHCNHTELAYEVSDWSAYDKDGKSRQTIVKTAEVSDMSWGKLSKKEKQGVLAVPAGVLLFAAGMTALKLKRWVGKYLPK